MLNLSGNFDRLAKMLEKEGIRFTREDEHSIMGMERHLLVHRENGEWIWDVACNTETYGADEGLLEYWSSERRKAGDDVSGWLTAEEALKIIKEENNVS